jgi:hypothetical protein
MLDQFSRPETNQIVAFLEKIGLSVRAADITERAFLPGIQIAGGVLLIDDARLEWPGDLLHEAAHLALTPADQRASIEYNVGQDGGEEIGALAWSWAALCHLQLAPDIVFHAGGYRRESKSLIENFSAGRYIGLPFLRWLGLAGDDFPHMIKWLRD